MTDKELLEFAAKAAGIELTYVPQNTREWADFRNEHGGETPWNPLIDDGDALRLAVKLGIYFHIVTEENAVSAKVRNGPRCSWREPIDNDPYAATRRAMKIFTKALNLSGKICVKDFCLESVGLRLCTT